MVHLELHHGDAVPCYPFKESHRITGHGLRQGDAFAEHAYSAGRRLFPDPPVSKERKRFSLVEEAENSLTCSVNPPLDERWRRQIGRSLVQFHQFIPG